MKKSKFTEEQVARILQEGATGQSTQTEPCRKHGVSQNTYYIWKRKYGGMETGDVRRLKELGLFAARPAAGAHLRPHR